MKIFAKFGELILRLFDTIGIVIFGIPKVPEKVRDINTDHIKNRVDREALKENISKIKDTGLEISESGISKISEIRTTERTYHGEEGIEELSISKSSFSESFTSEEKERTVFQLQILSMVFLVTSILYLFNFMAFVIFAVFGIILVSYMLYVLFTRIKLMFTADFNAYRDFFLMYIGVSIILVLVGTNPYFVMSYSFAFLPSLSILIFAVISVAAIYLIFRLKYHRDYTYGIVIETGKKTAYVKVDYDICSNVKPDTYVVDNTYGAEEGELVKLQVEEKLLSNSGNKPVCIIEALK